MQDSILSQEKFRELRDQGLYQPVIGGAKVGAEAGRPSGSTGIPQSTKNIKPIGEGRQSKAVFFDVNKIKENFVLASKLQEKVESSLREKHSLRKLSKQQKQVAFEITKIIVANEDPQNWEVETLNYVNDPKDKNLEIVSDIQDIAVEHSVDSYIAGILYHSKQQGKENG